MPHNGNMNPGYMPHAVTTRRTNCNPAHHTQPISVNQQQLSKVHTPHEHEPGEEHATCGEWSVPTIKGYTTVILELHQVGCTYQYEECVEGLLLKRLAW